MEVTVDTVTVDRGKADTTAAPNLNERIAQFVKLRDYIKKEDDEHKKKLEPFREALEKLNNALLDSLNQIGVDSLNSASGTVYRSSKTNASLSDPDAFMKFVVDNDAFELLDRKANKTAVAEFIKQHGVQPPGVKFTTFQVAGVRRP